MKTHSVTATRHGDQVFAARFDFPDDADPADALAVADPVLTGDPAILALFADLTKQAKRGDLLLWHPMGDVGEIDLRRLRAFEAVQSAMAKQLRWVLHFDIATQLPFAGSVPDDADA